MTQESLRGKRILVTRAREQSSRLQQLLEAAGADVIAIPAIQIVPPDSFDSLDHALRSLEHYDWLVLTSVNAVTAMQRRAQDLGIPVHGMSTLSIAAIGSATAEAIRTLGLTVDLVPAKSIAESLAESLLPLAAGKRILLVRAREARDLLPAALSAAGAIVTIAVAYSTVLPAASINDLQALADGTSSVDAILFTSASSVRNLAQLAAAAGFPVEGCKKISIGPITSAALAEHGWHADAQAASASMDELVSACARVLQLRT